MAYATLCFILYATLHALIYMLHLCYTMGLIIWSLLSRRTVGEMTIFAPEQKRTFRPLTPASEVVRGLALHFWKEVAETKLKW
jgi:hypothetical protein